jgi:lipoprotein NlpD
VVALAALSVESHEDRSRMKNAQGIGMLLRMDRHLQWLVIPAVSLLLAACGTMRSSVVVEPAGASGYTRQPVGTLQHADTRLPSRTPIPGGSYVVTRGDTLYSIAFRKGVDFRDLAQWNAIAAPYTIWPGQRLTLTPAHGAAMAHGSHAATSAAAPVFKPVAAPSHGATGTNPPATLPVVRSAAPAVAATAPAVVPVAGMPAPATASAPPAVVPAGASREVSGVHWRWPADGSLISRFQKGDAIPGIEIAGKSGDPVRAAADGMVVYSGNGLVGYGELVIIKHSDSFLSAYGHNRKRLVKEGQRVSAGQQVAEMGSTGATRNELEFQIRRDGNPVNPLDYLPPR